MIDTYPAIICCLRVPLGDTIKRLLLVGRRSKHHPGLPPLRLGFDSWLVRGLRLVDLNLIPNVSSTKINFHAQVGVVERINHDPLTPETVNHPDVTTLNKTTFALTSAFRNNSSLPVYSLPRKLAGQNQ